MKTFPIQTPAIAAVLLFSVSFLCADGGGTSAGLTLVESPSARASALGEAMAAQTDDVSMMGYNPAGLGTLTSSQASFIYHKGMGDDAFAQLHMGAPFKHGAAAFSLGYFNAGEIESFDGTTRRHVTIQEDLSLSVGYASRLRGVHWGLALKFLSSELADREKGSAIATDLGLQVPVRSRLVLGASLQNIGSKLNYAGHDENLPRFARAGASYLFPGRFSTKLYAEGIHDINESTYRPAAGLEVFMGPLAIRGGYQGGRNSDAVSFGTGFLFSNYTLDYSFVMADQLDAQHLMSLSVRFQAGDRHGSLTRSKESGPGVKKIARPSVKPLAQAGPPKPLGGQEDPARVYLVKPGDTLQSIAKRFYGKSEMWKVIYNSNKFILPDPASLQAGQKIVIPAKWGP